MTIKLKWAALVLLAAIQPAAAQSLALAGLHQPVEIIRDHFGIAHIYAKDEHDLFFAQGYNVASDRLFQLEIWRRQATGTVAEILGPKELQRDIGNRLFRYRGDLTKELNWYHPRGRRDRRRLCRRHQRLYRPDRARSQIADAGIQDAGDRAGQMDAGRGDLALQRAAGQCRQRDRHGAGGEELGRARRSRTWNISSPAIRILRIDPAIDASLLSKDILKRLPRLPHAS